MKTIDTVKFVQMQVTDVLRENVLSNVDHYGPKQIILTNEGDAILVNGNANGVSYTIPQSDIVKLTSLFDGAKEDVYIAYDKAVYEFLQLPLNCYKKQLAQIKVLIENENYNRKQISLRVREVRKYERANFWQRFLYLFSGYIKNEPEKV